MQGFLFIHTDFRSDFVYCKLEYEKISKRSFDYTSFSLHFDVRNLLCAGQIQKIIKNSKIL